MIKTKSIFEVKRINKRKKGFPVNKLSPFKKFLRRYSMVLRRLGLAIFTLLLMSLVYQYQRGGGYLFKASVLDAPLSFTGTVYPVDRVPDWTHFTGDKSTQFSEISANLLVSLPAYDLTRMQYPDSELKWGSANDDIIRNTKITYPVVYAGNYHLDHVERVGSHPAIDIKLPLGTPVKSIANGRVLKVSMIETGFGHHVVVQHQNVPDPDDASKKTTLYSAFNHMDKIYVAEGQVVKKGDLIGTSGNTGTSTTPHLHFQIDRDTAPWHPYWPFSWQESQQAGLSFFEAVNAGLGMSNIESNTINPMPYVAKYLNYSGGIVSDPVANIPNPETIVEVPVIPEDQEETAVDTSLFDFQLSGEPTSMINNGITVTAIDNFGQIEKMTEEDVVRVTVAGDARVSKNNFRKVDFQNNSIKFIVNSSVAGTYQVQLGKSAFSVNFVDAVKPIASLRVDSDGNFQKGKVEALQLVALDENGDPTPVANFSGKISLQTKNGKAAFTPSQVESRDFKNGSVEIRMLPIGEEFIVIRAQNGALVGESDQLTMEVSQLFSDVSLANPHYEAIKFLAESDVINGYSDGSFRPELTVNRVEALKMLTLAFNTQSGPAGSLPFVDTEDTAWYAGTLSTALERSIVKGYDDGTFRPSATVNVAEYLKMLYLTSGIQPTSDLAANPYADVPKNAWYAPFAYLTNKQNLMNVQNNRLRADSGMTRGNVAETIYRLKYIQDHNLVTYSK